MDTQQDPQSSASPATAPDESRPGGTSVPDDVVVFTGGDAPPARVRDELPAGAFIIAADSGLGHALELAGRCDLVVGDLDSVLLSDLEAAVDAGAMVERHPLVKDQTDLELALDRAVSTGARRVIVIGGYGGRLDHFLANVLLLASPRYAAVEVDAFIGEARVQVVRDELAFTGTPGDLVTLLPANGEAREVRTKGLRYPLNGELLVAGSSRGVSNELVAERAWVGLGTGVLLVVRPDAPGTSPDAFPGAASPDAASPTNLQGA